MLLFIDSGLIIGNAFIAALESENKRFISWEKICIYGNKIYEYYEEKGEQLCVLFTKAYTLRFLENYKDWFREIKSNGEAGIMLLDSVDIKTLRKEFRNVLNTPTSKVFEKVNMNINF